MGVVVTVKDVSPELLLKERETERKYVWAHSCTCNSLLACAWLNKDNLCAYIRALNTNVLLLCPDWSQTSSSHMIQKSIFFSPLVPPAAWHNISELTSESDFLTCVLGMWEETPSRYMIDTHLLPCQTICSLPPSPVSAAQGRTVGPCSRRA